MRTPIALPAVDTKTTPPKADGYFLVGGIEQLTYDLRRGRAVRAETVAQADTLIRRVEALRDALDMRLAQTVIDENPDDPGAGS